MNASAPFKSKAPFHARIIGLDYQAFGLDFINPPFPSSQGCLSVTPTVNWDTSGHSGGPFSVPSIVYILTNNGITTIDWTAGFDQNWVDFDVASGTLDPGASVAVTATLNGVAYALPQAVSPYTGIIVFANTTNGCGDTNIGVSLAIANTISLDVYGRTKGGTATLIGFSEYASPSTPPKKYLIETQVGDTGNWGHDCNFGYTGCSGYAPGTNVSGNHRIYSGSATYDVTTGLVANGFSLVNAGRIDNVPSLADCLLLAAPLPITPSNPTPFVPNELNFNLATTQTTLTYTFTPGNCIGLGVGPCADGHAEKRAYIGTLTVTLSSEDTESDAIARLVAASSYTSYSLAASAGGIKSEFQNRISGFSLTYELAQYQLRQSGLTPSTLYNGSCVIYRRLWGTSGPWSLVSTTVVSGTTDISGDFVFGPISLPMAQGYEYTVWNATLVP